MSSGSSSWRSLILRIGEKCPEYASVTTSNDDDCYYFHDHIETCTGVVRREISVDGDDDVLSFLLQCAEQLPHKIPFYGTVVGLLNLENEDFVGKLVENTRTNLQDALDSEDCNRIRILIRFLTAMMCSKIITPSSLVVIYEALLSSAATTVDEEKGNPSWQARADFYIYCILCSLPWGGSELVEQVPDEIERVTVGVEAYLRIRQRVYDNGLSVFEEIDHTKKSPHEKDFLEDLWVRIQDLANSGWKLESVPRPHLSFEAQLVGGKSHDLGPINCPEQPGPPGVLTETSYSKQKHEADLKYPQRICRLNIFPESKFEGLSPIDRFVVEEYLLDVLFFLNGWFVLAPLSFLDDLMFVRRASVSRKECAAYMAGLPVRFRYEYLMAETIFSQLVLLPHPPFKPMYYTLVIIDLCKALPGAFPAVVAGAVRALFDKLAYMDMECRTRFINWFSQHLSNFQFIWPWDEWAFVLDLPKWAPQRVFVQEVLEKEIRLSYWEKIKQSIENAPGLESLLPPKEGPSFTYGRGGVDKPEYALSVELNGLVKSRASIREIILWIEESVAPVHDFEITLRVVVQTLLDIGSKSFTHLITVLERYGQAISKLCSDQDKQVMLIVEISSYWKNSSQMTAIAIDRMMGYRLISNVAIVRWVFSPENVDQFHTSDRLWEVLRNAVNKTYNRVSDLRREIAILKRGVVKAEESASRAKAELEVAESKVTLIDGEPVVGDNPGKMKRLKANVDKTKEDEISAHDTLEAKEALLARAIDENQALFLTLFKNFSTVLMERLDDVFQDETLQQSGQEDDMAIDLDESAAMDLDKENGRPRKGRSYGEQAGKGYNIKENEQWGLATLSHVKAFSRQYASEIWPHIERLDAEVLSETVHPLFRKAVYSGLGRPLNEL